MRIDLHTHSTVSDGTDPPAALVHKAAEQGLDVLGLTDHDTFDGLPEALAAGASLGAYSVVVWAMTQAPIALVGALRETSILFAVLIGWLFFGDRMDRGKAIAALLIVAGVGMTRL